MSRVTYQDNYRAVAVADFNQFYSDRAKQRAEKKSYAEDLVRQIRKHCDGFRSVDVEYDTLNECGYCGAIWTEDGDQYNGGCCSKDQENDPEQP